MRKLRLIIAALLLFPCICSAGLIRLSYEAEVTLAYTLEGFGYDYGEAFGYQPGDTVSGWFQFNIRRLIDSNDDGYYEMNTVVSNRSDLVDRYEDGTNGDTARFNGYPNSLYSATFLNLIDLTYVEDSGLTAQASHYFGLSDGWDWLDFEQLASGNFSIQPVDLRTNYGGFSDYKCGPVGPDPEDPDDFCEYGSVVEFRLTSLVARRIPEPSTLALLSLGLLGLGLSRRRKKIA